MSASPFETSRRQGDACLSELQLDRLLASELEGDALRAATTHLDACPACGARLRELEAEAASFRAEVPIELLAARTLRAAAPSAGTSNRRWAAMIGGVLAAAAALALFFVLPTPDSGPGGPEPTTRTKGDERLEIFVRHPGGLVEEVEPGDALSPEDAIRFRVSTMHGGTVAVIGIDAAGVVTAYAPYEGEPLDISAGYEQLLEGSIILDRTLGPERIVALFCGGSVRMNDILEAARHTLREAGDDPRLVGEIPVDCRQTSLLIRKVERP